MTITVHYFTQIEKRPQYVFFYFPLICMLG